MQNERITVKFTYFAIDDDSHGSSICLHPILTILRLTDVPLQYWTSVLHSFQLLSNTHTNDKTI